MIGRLDAIVFDFDGVLVDSADVKTRAFAALYAEYGSDIERQVREYHLANVGISRYRKFRYYQEQLLGVPYSDEDGERLSARFSQLVVEAIVAAPYVPGAQEFLQAHSGTLPLFVASGTPQEELLEIVARRGMAACFVSVHGSPRTKAEILRGLIAQHGFNPERVLMVGDAMADLDGARQAGTGFLGRATAEGNPFPTDVTTVNDLSRLSDWL